MALFVPAGSALSADLTPLLSIAAFVAGGVVLIVSGIRSSLPLLRRRVDAIRPRLVASVTDVEWEPHASAPLFRLAEHGIPQAEDREIVRQFSKLGVPANWANVFYVAFRFALAAGMGLLTFVVVRIASPNPRWLMLVIPLAFAVLGWLLPSFLVGAMLKRRTQAIASGLPDALELLVICVEAGLSLEDGLARVVGELAQFQPHLAEELALTAADLKILPSREQAFANLAERVDLASIRSVVGTLSQTLRYGTPLAQSLRAVAAEMRNDYLANLEERANRLPALMTIPVMLLLMPSIFLIIGGPATLRLIDTLPQLPHQ